MTDSKRDIYQAKIRINNGEETEDCTVEFSFTTSMSISFAIREGLNIYTFNKSMIRTYTSISGAVEENYKFSGPLLGIYHKTEDIREGPCINHLIEKLEIQIKHHLTGRHLKLCGEADLSRSNFDNYYYKGPRTGTWCFELEFSLPIM